MSPGPPTVGRPSSPASERPLPFETTPSYTTDHHSYAGHFLFTNLVLPLLKTASRAPGADVRIVHFSSQAPMHFLPASYVANFASPDVLVNPLPYHPWTWRWMNAYMFVGDMVSYSVAKVALTSFAAELQRRLDAEGVPILSIAINPGNIDTEQAASCITPMLRSLVVKTFISVDEGVKHGLYTATSPALREGDFGGKFLMPFGQVAQLHPLVDNEEEVTALWKNTEVAINELLGKKGLQPLQAW
jgi:NAD(P)-dependent dehydrogenase (short-subunit alcohol dehydrogenase family)